MNRKEIFEQQFDQITLEGKFEEIENLIAKIELQDEYIKFITLANKRLVEKLKNKELNKNEKD